jgi:hypothetical protein
MKARDRIRLALYFNKLLGDVNREEAADLLRKSVTPHVLRKYFKGGKPVLEDYDEIRAITNSIIELADRIRKPVPTTTTTETSRPRSLPILFVPALVFILVLVATSFVYFYWGKLVIFFWDTVCPTIVILAGIAGMLGIVYFMPRGKG